MKDRIENNISLLDELISEISNSEQHNTDKKMAFAIFIKKSIKQRGWSKEYFAEQMNRKQSDIDGWLSGTHDFTYVTIQDMGNIFGWDKIVYEFIQQNYF